MPAETGRAVPGWGGSMAPIRALTKPGAMPPLFPPEFKIIAASLDVKSTPESARNEVSPRREDDGVCWAEVTPRPDEKDPSKKILYLKN